MHYFQQVQQTRTRVAKGERIVEAQRDRLVQLNDDARETWMAKSLLAASEKALWHNRRRLRELLDS